MRRLIKPGPAGPAGPAGPRQPPGPGATTGLPDPGDPWHPGTWAARAEMLLLRLAATACLDGLTGDMDAWVDGLAAGMLLVRSWAMARHDQS
ncbi:hypothetical protein ACWF62_17675 [Rhodococcus sp. NPDC054953]